MAMGMMIRANLTVSARQVAGKPVQYALEDEVEEEAGDAVEAQVESADRVVLALLRMVLTKKGEIPAFNPRNLVVCPFDRVAITFSG